MLLHFVQDERESDGSRLWEAVKKYVLLRKFELMKSKISVTKRGYKRFLKAAQRQKWRIVKTKIEFYVIYERFKGILEVFQPNQNWWVMSKNPPKWKKYIYHRGRSWNFVHTGKMIPGGKEKDKCRQAVFLTPTNPFGDDLEEGKPHDDITVSQKAPHVTKWKNDQDAVFWVRLSKAQDQGLEFWKTKSVAIMTYVRYATWRLYWSCDISRWRPSYFRKAWNSKAVTQGNVEKELAKPAAAAFLCLHRRTWPRENDGSKN